MVKMGSLATVALVLAAAVPGAEPARHGISNVRYDVTWTRETAARREIHVEMSFDVDDDATIALSLPSWTPGSYELDDYAKNVRTVWARSGDSEIHWDKEDFDTWRVYPSGAGRVTLGFDYFADALDVGSAWSADDFAFFNGTNLFPYPEDGELDFDAEVRFHTEADWEVATGLTSLDEAGSYSSRDYHELVDMPTFVGDFDFDSAQVDGTWYRLATYPSGQMAGQDRALLWDQIQKMVPPMAAVTGDVPWGDYTTLMVFDAGFGGGSALEHSNSHLGVYHPQFIGSPILASITAHEIFHAWNVKRIRPADMWPYEYGRQMPTELLWVSEGITDYYADLALIRGDIVPRGFFYQITQGKIETVNNTVPVALEDASLSAWIGPTDGTASIYYPKGSLAGFMLDILIRDASDNEHSLDDVIKTLYNEAYRQGNGFTEEEFWAATREAAGSGSFEAFHDAYIDGRDVYPWSEILPLAGLELDSQTDRVARIGISTTTDENGTHVASVVAGGSASGAGVLEGDDLVSLGGIAVEDADFGALFRARFETAAVGSPYEMIVTRDGRTLTLAAELQFADVTTVELRELASAGEKAVRIRDGILTGG
jgi:predicted metalloprotease with PDZ domain